MATIPTALRPRLSRKAIAGLLVAALGVPLVAGAGWIAFSDGNALGEMEIRATGAGDVIVLRDGESIPVDGTVELEPLDLVSTAGRATAKFNLEGDRSLELAQTSSVEILSATSVGLLSGSMLAETGSPTKVMVGEVEVAAPGSDAIFRLDRMSSVRTGVYDGAVELSAPAEGTVRISRYFEASVAVAAPNVPSRPAPYGLDAADRWDQEHFSSILNLDDDLTATSRGLAGEFSGRPPLSYYAAVTGSGVGFMKPYMKHRPSDLLIGLTVAKGAKSIPLAQAFRKALGLFDRGARWGIAAAIMQAQPKTLLKGLSALIAKSGLTGGKSGAAALNALVAGGAVTTGPGGTLPDGSGGPVDDPTAPPTNDPTDPPEPTPPPDPDPTTTPTDPPSECSELECTIEDIDPPIENPLDKDPKGGGGDVSVPDLSL